MTGQQQKKLVTNEDSRDFILRCVRDRYPILYKTPGFSDIGRRLGVCSYLYLASWHATRIQPERWCGGSQITFVCAFSLTYGFCVVFAKAVIQAFHLFKLLCYVLRNAVHQNNFNIIVLGQCMVFYFKLINNFNSTEMYLTFLDSTVIHWFHTSVSF